MRTLGLRKMKQTAQGHTAHVRELRLEFKSLCFPLVPCLSACEWNVFLISKLF